MSRFFRDEGQPRQTHKVLLATTTYGNPDCGYTFSIQNSREALHKAGFQTAYYLLQGNCHVDDARNRVVQAFLESDCDDLVFLDADVSWRPDCLVTLCRYDRDVVGGVYPYKREDKANEVPARIMEGAPIEADGLVEMEGLPTGFLRIRRRVFEKLAETAECFPAEGGVQHIFFQRVLINGTRWGGDLHFCNTWRKFGKVYADPEMVLGHAGNHSVHGSLATVMRKRNRQTLAHVARKVRAGKWTVQDLIEAIAYVGNPWGAQEDTLALAISYARKADGPIIETGSGLSTVLMAAASKHVVYCLEHDPVYVARIRQLCVEAGVPNVGLCAIPIKDGWYDLDQLNGLPEKFAFGLNDGPPRALGDRATFFDRINCPLVVCDDAKDYDFSKYGEVERITDRAAIVRR